MGFKENLEETTKKVEELTDQALTAELQRRGYIVHQDAPNLDRHIELDAPEKGHVKIAVTSDNHLGSKYQQVSLWRQFYEEAKDFGADLALNGGDLVDGTNMHKDQQYELFVHGASAQGKYAIEHMPVLKNKKRQALPTYGIGGNHDGSFYKDAGADVLTHVADHRDDYTFLGAPTATFHISGLDIMLMHPAGGVPYARSYKPQKIVEQFPPDTKPHILLLGHWHVPVHVPGYRNVEAISLPCFQSQTPFLRRLGLAPVVGGVLLDLEFSKRGLESLRTHWVTYKATIEKDW